jgi:hypothetical protein
MREWLAFLFPPAMAFAGMRLARLVLGRKFEDGFGLGLRLAVGLAVGMLVFSQTVLLTALAGINAARLLAWTAMVWGTAEAIVMSPKCAASLRQVKFRPSHLWLLLLLPLLYSWWVFGRLCTLEGTIDFDANTFWVFKAKLLYVAQGKSLLDIVRQPSLAYANMDYPLLVPCLYTLNYGLVNGVDEFVNKVWPFWMMVALCLATLSMANIWKRPQPLPLLVVTVLVFLPASLRFTRTEGGTIPMVFYTGLTALLMVVAFSLDDEIALAAAWLTLAGCAMTKFEGILYATIWGCATVVFCWRRGWLNNRLLWKTALAVSVWLIPYFCFRLAKPVLRPESFWIQDGIRSPGSVLRRFPQTWTLNIINRFFSFDFFHWQTTDGDHVQWHVQGAGLKSLVNPELSVLPWLLLFLVGFSLWWKARRRLALATLAGVIIAQFTILSFSISCLPRMQADVMNVINFSINSDAVARYYYPFFTACFLGVLSVWFSDIPPTSTPPSLAK